MTKKKAKVITKVIGRNDKGYYTISGNPDYISVTTGMSKVFGVPSSMIKYYYCKLGYDEAIADREAKGEYGTNAHKVLEDYFINGVHVPEDFTHRAECIAEKYNELGLEILAGELTGYSHKLKAAGTMDVLAIYRDTIYIIDYKTGSQDKHKECMQLGTYGQMIIEMIKSGEFEHELIDKDIEYTVKGLVIHIGREDKTPKFTTFDEDLMKEGAKAFKNVLNIIKYRKIKK